MIWLLITILLSTQANAGKLKIENPYIRPADKGMTSALYFKVVNRSNEDDTLYDVRATFCEAAQIHESYMKDGMMGMKRVKYIVVPAGSVVRFKPGGYHVMLINVKRKLANGDRVRVEILFKRSGKFILNAKVHD
ncbi:MAG: copper chaperone PCu(A)C [Candidatus Kryptoniota bacterium]